jgi:hypothetical protein
MCVCVCVLIQFFSLFFLFKQLDTIHIKIYQWGIHYINIVLISLSTHPKAKLQPRYYNTLIVY